MDIVDIAVIADIVMDIADIVDIVADIANIADIADRMLQILWRCIQSVMGVFHDSYQKTGFKHYYNQSFMAL